MAEEYLSDVIRRGAKAIHRWRELHPKTPMMLVGLDLSGQNLSGADLSRANMSGCNMHLTNLIGAYLKETKLTGAKLRGANLVGANLGSADLQNAVLTGAMLQNASLQGADLRGANLRQADLRGANLRGANFEGADFQDAILTPAEQAQLQGPDAPGAAAVAAEAQALIAFTAQLGAEITAVELARLLKAFDDVHVFLGLAPVRIEQAVINLHLTDQGAPKAGQSQPGNCLVVRLDRKAAEWIHEATRTGPEQLRSQQVRILRYKKLGVTEGEVWETIRPLVEDDTDPLAAIRDLLRKKVLLSLGAEMAAPPPEPAPPPPAAPEPPPPPAPAAASPAVDEGLRTHIEELESPDWSVRAAAAEYLGTLGPAGQAAMPYLMKAAEDENIFVREAAEEAIQKIAGGS